MSIDALLLHLEEDATREAARLRSAAAEAARELVARAEADAARRRARHLERVAADHRRAGERQVAAARATAREQLLRVRAAVLDRIFSRATTLLEGMPADRYAANIGTLAGDAVRYLEGGATVLECPPDAVAALAEAVRGAPDVTVRAAQVSPGITGKSADGRVLVDNSLPALLARRRPDLAIDLAARIEGG